MSLITLLVVLILACLVVWAARAILAAFGVGDPIRTVVYVVIVLLVVLWAVSQLTGVGSLNLRL